MSRVSLPMVGNEFVVPQPRLQPSVPIAPPGSIKVPDFSVLDELTLDLEATHKSKPNPLSRVFELFHRYSLISFALLFLIVAGSAVQVGAAYWSATIEIQPISNIPVKFSTAPKHGPNSIARTSRVSEVIASITAQPITIAIGPKTETLKSDVIKSWLQISSDKATGVSYIHVDKNAVTKSLNELAAPYITAPLNQVSINDPSGTSRIISSGKNGTKLGDITEASAQINKSLLAGSGMQLTLPTETLAFAANTVADFDKLIEVNIVSKQMYLYEKGQITHTYPISAGAVATPTPIGQYKIYEKLAVQDMRGFNANGTRYFQPHVRWINYFLPGGYAVHGNYWRPKSWFGAVNSSHGCVSLPDTQAKEVYDWAPIGTTVITHT